MNQIWLFYSFLFIWTLLTTSSSYVPHVCIIGSGLSGSTTSFFLSEFSDKINLHVFEKEDQVGGRVSSFMDHGIEVEAGGSVIHKSNRYVMHLAKAMGLKTQFASEGSKTMGIHNGKEFIFQSSKWKIYDGIKMFWRYGRDLFKMRQFVDSMIEKFTKIYEKQDKNTVYSTPEELYRDLGLYDLTQKTLADTMLSKGISPLLINELMAAINRVNYGQNCTLNGFAGAVGLAGSGDDLRKIEGGNKKLIERLLEESKATVHLSTYITSIEKVERASVMYELTTSNNEKHTCDGVVLATPIEESGIKLFNQAQSKMNTNRVFQLTHTTFVYGTLQQSYFQSSTPPEIILTTEDSNLPFSSIGLSHFLYGKKMQQGLYKVFSRKAIDMEVLHQIFGPSMSVVKEYPWKAYPHFNPPERFSDFLIDDCFVYVNAIETAASALEIMSIGGRNAALLLHKALFSGIKSSDQISDKNSKSRMQFSINHEEL